MPESTPNSSTADTSKLQVEQLPEPTQETSDVVQQTIQVQEPSGYQAVQDFLGMSLADEPQKEKMQFIWDAFSKGRDRATTLEAISAAKHRLSPPEIGESYLHKLYVYARLTEDGRSIEREKKVLEK